MKNILFLLFLAFFLACPVQKAKATGQTPERIIINGDTLSLFALPLSYLDSVTYKRFCKTLSGRMISTGLWRNYVGEWEVKDSTLYLNKVVRYFRIPEEDTFTNAMDAKLLEKYKDQKGIKASWFSGNIRCGKGKIVQYEHMGFNYFLEYETIYTLKEGKIVSSVDYHNTIQYDTSPISSAEALGECIRTNFRAEKFPELKSDSVWSILYLTVTPDKDGNVEQLKYRMHVNYKEYANAPDMENPFEKEILRCLKLRKWPVITVHGKIQNITSRIGLGKRIPKNGMNKWNTNLKK